MTSSEPKPTLLIFTLGPCRENLRKSLLPRALSAAEHRLHQIGLERAIEAGRRAGCRVVVAAPGGINLPQGVRRLPQRGRSFGGRIRNALRDLQQRRPGAPVVVVGTDVPDLESAHIRAALDRLHQAPEEVVIGPSPDGGFYLLATRRSIDPVLSRVEWCRPSTLDSLIELLGAHDRRAHMLTPLRDLDRKTDVEIWLADRVVGVGRALARWLQRLLAAIRRPLVVPHIGLPQPARVPVRSGRGPPR